ncbi:MAG: hypothetical protein ACYDAO_02150 [Thermoplasmataceae archaeon]
MKWDDIDTKVSYRCVISIKGDSELFKFSEKYKISTPIILRRENQNVLITMLFDKRNGVLRNTEMFSKLLHAEDRGDKYFVKYVLEEGNELSIIKDILSTPSVIMNYLHLESDKVLVDFRFHKSMVCNISEILFTYFKISDKIDIDRFIPDSGIFSFLNDINTNKELSIVEFSFLPMEDDIIFRTLSKNDGWGEIQKIPGIEYFALLYLRSQIKIMEGVNLISENDLIYQTTGNNLSFQKIRKLSNNALIYRAEHLIRVAENRIFVSVFIPTKQVSEFLSIISIVRNEEQTSSLVVHRVEPYTIKLSETI